MKVLKNLTLLVMLSVYALGFSQEKAENINTQVDKLLASKLKQFNTNDYTIQLYYGNYEEAQKVKEKFEEIYEDRQCDIEFETPNYKVWVGKYSSRIEADKALLEIHKEFQNAFAVKLQ